MLSFLAWTLLIVLLLRIIFKYVVPYLLALYLKKKKGFTAEEFMNYNAKKDNKEGEITIKHMPNDQPKGFTEGEYIDYEDIKNENSSK